MWGVYNHPVWLIEGFYAQLNLVVRHQVGGIVFTTAGQVLLKYGYELLLVQYLHCYFWVVINEPLVLV